MSHFYVDDQLAFHPKVLAAGNEAMGMWVRAGAWSKSTCTGGFIPDEMAASLGTPKVIARLVKAGLWERVERGYQFHDWTEVAGNHSPEREKAIRRGNADRQARFKAKRKAEQGGNAPADATSNGAGNALPEALKTLPPVPVPYGDFYLSSPVPEREAFAQDDDGPVYNSLDLIPALAPPLSSPRRSSAVDEDHVRSELARSTGRIPTRADVLWVIGTIVDRADRSGTRVGDYTGYVLKAIRSDPFEWQQKLDRRGAELEVHA